MKMQSEKISDINKQIQEELQSAEVTPEQLEQETNKVFDVEVKLETIISHIETVIAQYETGSNAEQEPRDDTITESNRQSSRLKLPKINLPCFNGKYSGTFSFSPNTFQVDVFAINYISIAFPMKQFNFKYILRVIVWDSDTNFLHTFSLCSYAFLMKNPTASCF